MADIPESTKSVPSSDLADILVTIQNAADDWQAQGYPTALAEVRDMANVGRALMAAIADNAGSPPLLGWHPADCPSEIVSDLLDMLDDATRAAPPAMDREAVETDGYVLVPAVATRAMVDAADACVDAYSAYAAMVQTVGRKPIFAADVLTEQWLADVLQDTLEMDWNTIDGARGIVHALKNGLVTFPQTGGQIATASQITITPDLITLVKRLVVAGRTTGGTAGPDVGLMQALDDVERALSTLSADAIRQGEGATARNCRVVGSDLWRHVKRGTVYEVIGTAELQASQPQLEHAELVIYQGADGKLWARNSAEFHDGRFVTATPASHASDGGEA